MVGLVILELLELGMLGVLVGLALSRMAQRGEGDGEGAPAPEEDRRGELDVTEGIIRLMSYSAGGKDKREERE